MVIQYMINATKVVVSKTIHSYYLAEKFINKLKHSKKCTFISCARL